MAEVVAAVCLLFPRGQKGKGYYGAIDTEQGEDALANEFEEWVKSRNSVPDEIQAKVQKVRDMVRKNSAYGELEGDIQVSRDENGNYNLSYTQVKKYGELQSATIGVGDIPARKETTHTTYVMDKKGRRINHRCPEECGFIIQVSITDHLLPVRNI